MADLTYYCDGMFVRFMAETKAGIDAYNEIAKHNEGVAVIFNGQLKSTLQQLKAANITAILQKPKKATKQEVDNLFAELDLLGI